LNLDLEQRRRLLRESRGETQERASRLLGDEEYSNRKEIVSEWLQALPGTGDLENGRKIFEAACAACHSFRGQGYAVGPDLSDASVRSMEDLVSHILDPNMAIHPKFAAYRVELDSGEVETGLLHSESSDSVILLQAFARKLEVARRDIIKIESSGVSFMPEGLEFSMTKQEMRDLIAFLQAR
jgi:putative heme-binding domain-containing protein